jgi:hypothetical protein
MTGTRASTFGRKQMYKCPICDLPAKNVSPPSLDGVAVRCLKCGDYEISGTAIGTLLRLDQDGRSDALEKAKRFAQAGAKPAITARCL